jgi:hypothetical protein
MNRQGENEKPAWKHWCWRAIAIGGIMGFGTSIVAFCFVDLQRSDWGLGVALSLYICSVFCGFVAAWPGRSLIFFPFAYSAFGPKLTTTRTGLPGVERVPGHLLTRDLFDWTIFPDGLQIDILTIGSVFLPRDCVVRCEVGRWWVDVFHDCPQLRSPVTMRKTMFDSFWRLSPSASGQCPFRRETAAAERTRSEAIS